MPLLWNSETGRLEKVPDNDVTTGVASGRLSFRKGVRIPVVGPDGRQGTIAAEDSGSAFQNGWRFQTADEVRAQTAAGIEEGRAQAYDKAGTAFAAGILRGATVGLSDVAIGALGDGEAAREIRDRSPLASLGGEIVGGVAALASPLTPAAQVAKMGAAVTRGTTGALAATTRASKVVSELVGAGAGSLVEGAAYGAGQLLTEEALGDPELSAQQMMATVGLSGILGGALGVVGKGASQAWNRWKASSVNPAAVLGEGYGKATAKAFGLSGEAENEFVKVFERGAANERQEIVHYMANPDELYARGLAAVKELDEAGRAGAKLTGEIRQGAVGSVAADTVAPAQAAAATSVLDSLNEAAGKLGGSENFKKAVGADVAQVAQDLNGRLMAAESKGDVFRAMHEARMQLDGFTKQLRSENSYEAKKTMEVVNEIRAGLQAHLRDADTYGPLAKSFQEADEVFSAYLTAKENFVSQFTSSKYMAGKGKQKVVAPGKVEGLFRRPDADSLSFKREAIADLEESVAKLRDFAAKNGEDIGFDLGKISSEIETVKRLRVAELALSRQESFTGKSLSGLVLGASLGGVGSLISDDIGAGATGALAFAGLAAANPRMAVKYLSKIERLQQEFGARADTALTKLLNAGRAGADAATKPLQKATGLSGIGAIQTQSAGGAVRRGALMQIAQELAPEGRKPAKEDDALESLAPYIGDPSGLDDLMTRANPHLDGVAPATYAAMVNQSRAALAFMQSKWPQRESADAIFATPSALTASERHGLEAYAVGAFEPGSILTQLETGNVDPKTVEAVRTVHPMLFEDLRRRLVERIPDSKGLSYRQKLTIGTTFGIPTTQGLANISVIQQAISQPPEQQKPRGGAPDLQQLSQESMPDSMRVTMR